MEHTGEIDSSGIKGGAQSTQLNIIGLCAADQRKQTGKHMSGRWMRAASGAATRVLCDGEARSGGVATLALCPAQACLPILRRNLSHIMCQTVSWYYRDEMQQSDKLEVLFNQL